MSSKNPDTRTRILEASWALLEESGAKPVKMADIAKASGISRQALYLHFPTRAELLIATVRFIDQTKNIDERLAESRAAQGGIERLEAFIEAWCSYIPEVAGLVHALIAMADTDDAAHAAWTDRQAAIRHGCAAAIRAIVDDGLLDPVLSEEEATDLLAAILSIESWRQLVGGAGWNQDRYVAITQHMAKRTILRSGP